MSESSQFEAGASKNRDRLSYGFRVSLQTYSIREALRANLDETLERISEEFDSVELAGTARRPIAEFHEALVRHNIAAIGSHVCTLGSPFLDDSLAEIKAFLAEVPTIESLVFLPHPTDYVDLRTGRRNHRDIYTEYAGKLNRIAEAIDGRTILQYHAYDVDLKKATHLYVGEESDASGVDIILELTEERQVKLQLDTYFVALADLSIGDTLDHYRPRLGTVHVNEMSPERHQVAIGTYWKNWNDILDKLHECGVRDLVLEHDVDSEFGVFDELLKSLAHIRSIGVKA